MTTRKAPALVTGNALPRRTFLRGLGSVAVGLPFLDAMAPAFASSTAGQPPVRMAFFYVPNGMIMDGWVPNYEGKLGELPRTLKPLEPFKDDILQLGNLTHNTGRALLDGAGDHGRCCGSYLTGIQVKKSVVEIKSGVSFDQIVANEIGSQTRFPSLELGMDDARQAGDCDSGYSCAYTNNLAWRSATQPLPPILNPRVLFERMFGAGQRLSPEEKTRQTKYRRSVLDFVTEGTHKLEATLGPTDRRKLDEYLSAIREVERQIQRAETDNRQIDPQMEKPYGGPGRFRRAFQVDVEHDRHRVAGRPDARGDVPGDARRHFASVSRAGDFRRPSPADASSRPAGPDRESAPHQRVPDAAVRRLYRKDESHEGRRPQPAGQLHDRLRRGSFRRQRTPARRFADAHCGDAAATTSRRGAARGGAP